MTDCTFCPNEASCTIFAFDPSDALKVGLGEDPQELRVPLCEWCYDEFEEVKEI